MTGGLEISQAGRGRWQRRAAGELAHMHAAARRHGVKVRLTATGFAGREGER